MECVHECSICKCEINFAAFDASAAEGVVDNECYRLACKHAFHTTCLIKCLRTAGPGCPVCRDGGTPNHELRIERRNARIFIDMELGDEEGENEEEESADPFLDRFVSALNSSNTRVLEAKRALNQAMKTYNKFRDTLRKERRQAVNAAMREFRMRRYREFVEIKQRALEAVQRYQAQLRQELGVSAADLQFMTPEEMLRQPVDLRFSVRRQDPMRLSFWH